MKRKHVKSGKVPAGKTLVVSMHNQGEKAQKFPYIEDRIPTGNRAGEESTPIL